MPPQRRTFGSTLLSLALLEHEQAVVNVEAFRPIQYHHHHDRATCTVRSRKTRSALYSIFDLFDENKINDKEKEGDWDGDKVVPRSSVGSGYNNNWLMFFHNKSQNEKQSTTNSLATWNEEQQQQQQGEYEKIIEWQDSFHRNGLSDFCPPMSASLNCLMVGNKGGDDESSSTQLPWEEEAEAEITSLRVLVEQKGDDDSKDQQDDVDTVEMEMSSSSSSTTSAPMVRTSLVAPPHSSSSSSSSSSAAAVPHNTKAAVYDCIVDHGLLEAVIGLGVDSSSSSNQQAVRDLVFEAATAIREHGIYVLVTQTGLSSATKQLLEDASLEAGLEWAFELDGISNDHQQQFVSVARRFNTGVMPKVGKLSRFQP